MKMAAMTVEARTTATAATTLVMITCGTLTIAHFAIDAHEGRDLACFDIPGTFLHADSDEDITIC